MTFRTDSHNNPTAFTTDLAKEGGLVLGVDYEIGDSFPAPLGLLYTARILGDPIEVTIRLIDTTGFYTRAGFNRWIYIAIPYQVWRSLPQRCVQLKDRAQIAPPCCGTCKKCVIGFMYQHEGGTAMKELFA